MKSSKILTIIIFILCIIIVLMMLASLISKAEDPFDEAEKKAVLAKILSTTTPAVTEITASSTRIFTLEQIQKHKAERDCWTAIDGRVYNLSAWIKEHPAEAKAILRLCGTDGTKAYGDQNGGDIQSAKKFTEYMVGDIAID